MKITKKAFLESLVTMAAGLPQLSWYNAECSAAAGLLRAVATIAAAGLLSSDIRAGVVRWVLPMVFTLHKGKGKIRGAWSVDGSATTCSGCKALREYAAAHPEKKIVCGFCYDYSQEHDEKQPERAANTLNKHEAIQAVLQRVLFTEEEWTIAAPASLSGILRFNSSGDLENVVEARNHIRIAAALQARGVYCAQWTKFVNIWRAAVDAEGGRPGNLRAVRSCCVVDGCAAVLDTFKPDMYFDTLFVVYRNAGAEVDAGRCNECCRGKDARGVAHCDECRSGAGKGWACYKTAAEGGHLLPVTAERLRLD